MLAGWSLLTWSSRRWVSVAVVLHAWASQRGHSGFVSNQVEQRGLVEEIFVKVLQRRPCGLRQRSILCVFSASHSCRGFGTWYSENRANQVMVGTVEQGSPLLKNRWRQMIHVRVLTAGPSSPPVLIPAGGGVAQDGCVEPDSSSSDWPDLKAFLHHFSSHSQLGSWSQRKEDFLVCTCSSQKCWS